LEGKIQGGSQKNNEYLYLIESEQVRSLGRSERKRREKLENEASNRLTAQWDAEWQIEKEKQERLWNETHDENGDQIESEEDDKQDDNATDYDKKEDVPKRYWYEKKAKLVKKKAKTHKMVKEMCYFLIGKYDEWMHEKQKEIALMMEDGDKIEKYFEPISFCREGLGNVCNEAMFETKEKIYKFKKELKLPKKPNRKWEPPILKGDEIDEIMEDDVENNSEEGEEDAEEANDTETKSEL